MSLYGHRLESFWVELLDHDDNSLGPLDGVAGGSLSWNANAPLPGGGELELAGTDLSDTIDYSSHRVRPWWKVGEEEWPLGVYVLAAPETQYSATGQQRAVSLIDKITVVSDDRITQTLQVAAGSNVVEAARQQVLATGETRILATTSSATLSNTMTWAPGTSRLSIINDLLAVAGYWALSTNRWGQFVIEPYIAPADRPTSWEFAEGATSLHSPDWAHELPLWEATNHVTLVSQEDDAGNVWVATAVDDNPASPTSTVNMKRVLNPIVEENVEAASQADLQQQADRKLINNSNVVGVLSVAHAFVPVWYRDGVLFRSQGMDTKATIVEMSLDLRPGALVEATWRQT